VTEHRGESLDFREQAFTRREPVRAQAYLGEESGARKRTLGRASAGLGNRGSVDSVVVLAGVWVAEVDEQRLVPAVSRAARQRAARHA
jgi:hypothetical protein